MEGGVGAGQIPHSPESLLLQASSDPCVTPVSRIDTTVPFVVDMMTRLTYEVP